VIRGGYEGTGSGCGTSAPRGVTKLKPSSLVGNAIIDFSGNDSITVEGMTVDSTTVSYSSGQAPILNSGGTGDTLGLAPLSPVTLTGGAPAVAVELTGGSTKLRAVNVSDATSEEILCSGTSTGCTITGSKITGTRGTTGIVLADASGATVGGGSAALGNVVTGNGVGIDLTDGSSGNTIEHNKIKGNVFFGVVLSGPNALPELDESGGTSNSVANTFTHNSWTGNGTPVSGEINGGANLIDFSGFSTTGDISVGGSAPTLSSTCLTLGSTLPPFDGGTLSLVNACSGLTPEKLGPGTLININGALNANGADVSLFVTAAVNVGTSPTNVSVQPIIPFLGSISSATPAGTGVTANGQKAQLSQNNYGSGNSCNPTAPNTSSTLADGTGGGPPGSSIGGETGYLAC